MDLSRRRRERRGEHRDTTGPDAADLDFAGTWPARASRPSSRSIPTTPERGERAVPAGRRRGDQGRQSSIYVQVGSSSMTGRCTRSTAHRALRVLRGLHTGYDIAFPGNTQADVETRPDHR